MQRQEAFYNAGVDLLAVLSEEFGGLDEDIVRS